MGGCPAGSGRDTIRLSGTINLDANLPDITAPVDIRGPSGGYATVDGQDMYKIFDIHNGVNPNISNLILQNAYGNDSPSAIRIRGGGTLSNMQFRDNVTIGSGGSGAAVQHFFGDGILKIIDSSFTGNSAIDGGAVASDGNLFGRNLIFRNNTAFYFGGAVYLTYAENITLNQVSFENNMATGGGGAIFSFVSRRTDFKRYYL